jgi:FlgD Ig-like domain
MRKRLLPTGVAMALALGLLTASPAAAAYAVTISFPGDDSEFYSPFTGAATIVFTFDPGEDDATFSLRIRPAGGAAVHTGSAFVDADAASGTKTVSFTWPALSVNNPRTYEVVVYRGGVLEQSESFLLRPRLVRITDVAPDPFFPWIDDGHKDTTNVGFDLTADAETEAHVFRPNSSGKCCGSDVRGDSLGSLPAGDGSWSWDGRNDGGDNLGKGDYFVKIRGEDAANVVRWSTPSKVSIARTYRATTMKSKPARAYHHVGPVTDLVLGGGCNAYRQPDHLQILCQGAQMSVFWRWGLSSSERIERASFVVENAGSNDCPPSVRSKGHSKHESRFTVKDHLEGAWALCRVSTARITYSYPKAS